MRYFTELGELNIGFSGYQKKVGTVTSPKDFPGYSLENSYNFQ